MKRIALILLGSFCCLGALAQTDPAPAVLACFIADSGNTNVRNAPDGKLMHRLPQTGTYTLVVYGPQNGWWRILNGVVEELDGDEIVLSGEAWIHSSVVGLTTRNYDGKALPLRSEPRASAPVSGKITISADLVRPLDISEDGKWVKVSWGKVSGWAEAGMLCANPVSTCP